MNLSRFFALLLFGLLAWNIGISESLADTVNGGELCWEDLDDDGFGDSSTQVLCDHPDASRFDNDCDDSDETVFPGADEICDGKDNDCDGIRSPLETDDDLDSYIECTWGAAGPPGDIGLLGGDDCNDSDGTVYPGAIEFCDGRDNDCDGITSSDEIDDDADGYVECKWDAAGPPEDVGLTGGDDCDDGNKNVHPSALEYSGDYVDQDCDGRDINPFGDLDNDSVLDIDEDVDGDGDPNTDNTDSDGMPDYLDPDDDNDGIATIDESPDGDNDPTNDHSDDDGIPDYRDPDDDGDSILTFDEDLGGDGDPTNDNTDDDNLPNYRDPDDDNDGILTINEDPNGNNDPRDDDTDNDKIPDYLDVDSPGPSVFKDGFETTCPTYYMDKDGDGYGNADSSIQSCDGPPAGHVLNDDDCYDDSRHARPDQTLHFATHRGDGSFDYNCDGEETISTTAAGFCTLNGDVCDLTPGWENAAPNCGATGNMIESCSAPSPIGVPPFLECNNYSTTTAPAECR